MNEEQRYLFDLYGYIQICGAIPPAVLKRMNAYLDEQAEQYDAFRGQVGNEKVENLLTWGPDFLALLDHPVLLPMLKAVLGSHMRFDHDYAIFLQPGGNGLFLHGGGTPYDASQNYHVVNDRIYCGLVACVFALNDVPRGAGGFACIPGSHKSSFACPRDIALLNRDSEIVKQVPARAGDCILFTEALQHGTLPWKGPGVRRTLFYKYSPAHVRWGMHPYSNFPGNELYSKLRPYLNDTQRILLEPPLVDGKQRVP